MQHERQHADSYARDSYPSASEDRRPQSWNRAPAETTYATRPANLSGLGVIPCFKAGYPLVASTQRCTVQIWKSVCNKVIQGYHSSREFCIHLLSLCVAWFRGEGVLCRHA